MVGVSPPPLTRAARGVMPPPSDFSFSAVPGLMDPSPPGDWRYVANTELVPPAKAARTSWPLPNENDAAGMAGKNDDGHHSSLPSGRSSRAAGPPGGSSGMYSDERRPMSDHAALLAACVAGDEGGVRRLLHRGADHRKGWDGRALRGAGANANVAFPAGSTAGDTPLHVAARCNHAGCATMLMGRGAGAPIASGPHEESNEAGYSPLQVAASLGHDAVVRRMIEAGAHVDWAHRSRGRTALMDAAAGPEPPGPTFHLTSLPRLPHTHGGAGSHSATRPGWSDAGVSDADADADPEGRARCAALLIDAGASVTRVTASGMTPLMIAARCGGRGGLGVAEVLIGRCAKDAHALRALVNGRAGVAECGASALHFACQAGHAEVADALVHAGADVDAEMDTGATAMMLAVAGGHVACVALLLEAGAQVNSPSTWLDGRSARILAEELAAAEAAETVPRGGGDEAEAATRGPRGKILEMLESADKPITVRGAIMTWRRPACHKPDGPFGRARPGARAADAAVPPAPPRWAAHVTAFSGTDTRGVRFT